LGIAFFLDVKTESRGFVQTTTKRKWQSALMAGLLVVQVGLMGCKHPWAADATFLIMTVFYFAVKVKERL
jgi:hypothetical protein